MWYFLYDFKFWLWFIWQLPQNLVALLMIPFVGKMKIINYYKNCLIIECTRMHNGMALGNFIFISAEDAKRDANIYHECGHIMQSHILGWLYLLIITIPSIFWGAFKPKNKCYYDFYTEKWANKNVGLKVSKNQYKSFIYFDKK